MQIFGRLFYDYNSTMAVVESLKTMQVAYIPSENALPRARVPRSPTAPQRFIWAYTVPLAERRLSITERVSQ